MRAKISLSGLFLAAGMGILVGCAGTAPPQKAGTYIADEEATVRQATASRFKYCNVRANHMCQSPDSQLVFMMPLELDLNAGFPQFTEEFTILNDGFGEITIGTYEVAVVDNDGRWYYPHFEGPDGYHDKSTKFPALKLGPKEEVDIRFWGDIDRELENELRAISVQYRLMGEEEPITVVVSYKPSHIGDLAPQRIPPQRGD